MTPTLEECSNARSARLHYQTIHLAAERVRKTKGDLIPLETLKAPDGTITVRAVVDREGHAALEYIRNPDGTVCMLKQGVLEYGPVTGSDNHPIDQLTAELAQAITRELATGKHRNQLARTLITEASANEARHQIVIHARTCAQNCLAGGEDKPTGINWTNDLAPRLARAVAKEILDQKLTALCWGSQNRAELDVHRYNGMMRARDQLLKLNASFPGMTQYHITHTHRPGPEGPEPPTTPTQLKAALAQAMGLHGDALEVMAEGIEQGLWKRRTPKEISHICRVAAALGPPGRKAPVLDTIEKIRDRIPDPKVMERDPDKPSHHNRSNPQFCAWWLAALTIYARDLDPADATASRAMLRAKDDQAWLKAKAAEILRHYQFPEPPNPETTTWQELRRQS